MRGEANTLNKLLFGENSVVVLIQSPESLHQSVVIVCAGLDGDKGENGLLELALGLIKVG